VLVAIEVISNKYKYEYEAIGSLYLPSRDTSVCLHCFRISSFDLAAAGTGYKGQENHCHSNSSASAVTVKA
jgi:hypothetical protein